MIIIKLIYLTIIYLIFVSLWVFLLALLDLPIFSPGTAAAGATYLAIIFSISLRNPFPTRHIETHHWSFDNASNEYYDASQPNGARWSLDEDTGEYYRVTYRSAEGKLIDSRTYLEIVAERIKLRRTISIWGYFSGVSFIAITIVLLLINRSFPGSGGISGVYLAMGVFGGVLLVLWMAGFGRLRKPENQLPPVPRSPLREDFGPSSTESAKSLGDDLDYKPNA